jgi:nucleoside-diphosphate-sugar epimerase
MVEKPKIAITGTTGFLGSYLKEHFKVLGYQTTDHDLRKTPNPSPKQLCDMVVHLAGKAHDLKKVSDEQSYFDANTELTKKVFDAFLKSQASSFVYVSSIKAVADSTNGQLVTESMQPQSGTPYGKSKLAAEAFLLAQPLSETKKLYILRPCMIHGPGNKGNFNLLYQVVKKGIPWPLGAFDNKRSFLSVDNFCFVIDQILSQRLEPGTYHLADTEPLSTNQLVKLIASELNISARILPIPQGLVKAIARMGDWLPLPLNSERLEKLTENYVVSNQKLLTSLGMQLPVTAEIGMRKTIRSFINMKS